jgi:hypothetical protein
MTLMVTLALVEEAEDGAEYAEQQQGNRPPAIGTLHVQRWALPKPAPSAIRIALDFYEAGRPAALRPGADAIHATHRAEDVLRQGDSVTIVKNTMAGIKYPPEWLEQYLGRTGTILWTTAGGAMVNLNDEATWFPYAELKTIG